MKFKEENFGLWIFLTIVRSFFGQSETICGIVFDDTAKVPENWRIKIERKRSVGNSTLHM